MRRSINNDVSRVGNHEKNAFINSSVRGQVVIVACLTCRFVHIVKETKIIFINRLVRKIGTEITMFEESENDFWIELSGGSKKLNVLEIGIPLYFT